MWGIKEKQSRPECETCQTMLMNQAKRNLCSVWSKIFLQLWLGKSYGQESAGVTVNQWLITPLKMSGGLWLLGLEQGAKNQRIHCQLIKIWVRINHDTYSIVPLCCVRSLRRANDLHKKVFLQLYYVGSECLYGMIFYKFNERLSNDWARKYTKQSWLITTTQVNWTLHY
jgi:hypothetical protein